MEALTDMEKTVLARLAENPFAAQQDLAEALGIPRPTLAMHITQLTRKGYILGRAYVLAKGERLVCIGGSSVDKRLVASQPLSFKTSNPVATIQTYGGVARNVAENAAKLGADVSLISMVGDDEFGRSIIAHLKGFGIDTSNILVRPDHRTAVYTAVVADRELAIGFSDMEIFDSLNIDIIDRTFQHYASASWVLADCNLSTAVLKSLVEHKKNARFELAIDGVSKAKAVRIPSDLTGVDLLFLRAEEAAAYLDREGSPSELRDALIARGARRVAVVASDFSVYAATQEEKKEFPAQNRRFADFGGENDTIISATLCSLLRGHDFFASLAKGLAIAAAVGERQTDLQELPLG